MSVGSKVVLLVSLGFIGLLIWYYGASPIPAVVPDVAADPLWAPAVPAVTVQTPAPVAATVHSKASPTPVIAAAPTVAPVIEEKAVATRPVTTPVSPSELTMGAPLPKRFIPTTASTSPVAPRVPLSPIPRPSVTRTARTPAPSAARTHTVQPGDTLSELAERYYGSHQRWSIIVSSNPGLDPDRLRVGQSLVIPARAPAIQAKRPPTPRSIPAGSRRHTVTDGDSLSSIAERYYGHEKHWMKVFEANSSTLSGDPDRLRIGMVLAVPR